MAQERRLAPQQHQLFPKAGRRVWRGEQPLTVGEGEPGRGGYQVGEHSRVLGQLFGDVRGVHLDQTQIRPEGRERLGC